MRVCNFCSRVVFVDLSAWFSFVGSWSFYLTFVLFSAFVSFLYSYYFFNNIKCISDYNLIMPIHFRLYSRIVIREIQLNKFKLCKLLFYGGSTKRFSADRKSAREFVPKGWTRFRSKTRRERNKNRWSQFPRVEFDSFHVYSKGNLS